MSVAGTASRAVARTRLRPTLRALVLLAIVGGLGGSLVYPVRLYLDQREQMTALERETAHLEQANARLQAEVERLRDPEYLEVLARACLGMVRAGETAFAIVPKHGKPKPVPCTAGQLP
jgi:cell division protein FtsB